MKNLRQLMDLSGRVAAITGGAGHIGRAAGEALAELGATVVLLDLDRATCEAAAEELQHNFQTQTLGLVVDLEQETQVRAVPEKIVAEFGRLDILINCAALVGTSALQGWSTPFLEQSADTWRRALEINLTAAFVLTQASAPALIASGAGSVINVGSIYGMVGPEMSLYEGTTLGNPAAYAASKGGLLQLTRWMATNLAPHVRVNSLTPGGVLRGQSETFQQRYTARTPLRRMATEGDFKGAFAYLGSDASAYVTGQNLVVDGGWTAW